MKLSTSEEQVRNSPESKWRNNTHGSLVESPHTPNCYTRSINIHTSSTINRHCLEWESHPSRHFRVRVCVCVREFVSPYGEQGFIKPLQYQSLGYILLDSSYSVALYLNMAALITVRKNKQDFVKKMYGLKLYIFTRLLLNTCSLIIFLKMFPQQIQIQQQLEKFRAGWGNIVTIQKGVRCCLLNIKVRFCILPVTLNEHMHFCSTIKSYQERKINK